VHIACENPEARGRETLDARLRAQLTVARIPHRSVRFRDDEEGAGAVRAHHEKGFELSPTVVVGPEYLTNPSLRRVREAMARR
jgi:mycoredoxin